MNADQIGELMEGLGKAATAAAQVLALASTDQKNSALRAAAAAVRARRAAILAANERDMSAARAARLSGPRLERSEERRVGKECRSRGSAGHSTRRAVEDRAR